MPCNPVNNNPEPPGGYTRTVYMEGLSCNILSISCHDVGTEAYVALPACRCAGEASASERQLVAALAVTLKRGWLELSPHEQHQFFSVRFKSTLNRTSAL